MSRRRARSVAGRKFVVVDLENLVGCSPTEATPAMYAEAFDHLDQAVRMQPSDLVVIGVNPALAFVAHDLAPSAALVTKVGPNGADDRLVSELQDVSFLRRRVTDVVVASGDVAFLGSVLALNQAGIATTVVSLRGQLSAALQLAARQVLWLPTPTPGVAVSGS